MKKTVLILLAVLLIFLPLSARTRDYTSIVNSDIQPGIKSGYSFPVSKQFKNGCFAFAVRHVVEYKYKTVLDVLEAEKTIKKPRNELWTSEHISNFLKLYNISLSWFNDAPAFFRLLSRGEPVIIQYKYPTARGWVGHFVAVYSFDKTGVYVSDSISAGRIHLTYDQVFNAGGETTQFSFCVVEMEVEKE